MKRTTRKETKQLGRSSALRMVVCTAATAGVLASVLAPATVEARTITADVFIERAVAGGTSGCTLREAIKAINQLTNVNGCLAGDGNNDTIKLVPGAAYDVALSTTTDSLTISRGLTIAGNGVDSSNTIRPATGTGSVPMFVITSSNTVTIQGVILRDVSAEALVVKSGASARVFFSWFVNNGNTQGNGAVSNSGGLTISGVEFSGNRGWQTAGVFNQGSVFIENSSFVSGNAARVGALQNSGTSAWASVVNSTFGKNIGDTQALAIANFGGFMDLQGVTVLNNGVSSPTVSWATSAVRNDSPGTLRIKNSFISSNTNNATTGNPNCTGAITSLGYNYLGQSKPCQPVATQPTDVSGGSEGMAQSSGLPVRQGGITRVYVPQPGSMAISRIPEYECSPTDQRGLGRKDGSNCEIGAANRAHATLVVGNATAPAAEDLQMASWLQGLGFDIYFHDDDWATADLFDPGLTIGIISTTVSDATVGTKYRDAPNGLVINKVSALDNMSMVASNAYGTFNTGQAVTVPVAIDYFHLLIGNAGANSINNGGGGWGTPSGSPTTLVTYNFNNKPAIFRFTSGSTVAGGFVLPGARISFPGWPSFFTGSGSTAGKNMFFEAVFWASRNRN